VSERQSLPVVTCDGCGACCNHMGSPPEILYRQDGGLSRWGRGLPAAVRDELAAYVAAYGKVRLERDQGPCLWLDPVTKGCRHYEYRPEPCRELPVGGASCFSYRRQFGLAVPEGRSRSKRTSPR
jgi:Fe-S-cluster containining protein